MHALMNHTRALLLAGIAAAGLAQEAKVAADFDARPTHEFIGFGTSMVNASSDHQRLGHAEQQRLADLLWRDANLRILRLWFHLDSFSPAEGDADLDRFAARYVDSGIIEQARRTRQDADHPLILLLAPSQIPPRMRISGPEGHHLDPEQARDYAMVLAQAIERMRDQLGVTIDVTGIQNEPNHGNILSPACLASVVTALRVELDARNLQDVGIIGPETASVDRLFFAHAEALRTNAAARSCLTGLAGHSYNMALDRRAAQVIAESGLPYWTTESGENGPERPGDRLASAGLAARAINDIALGASAWIWFIGAEIADPRDDRTRLIRWRIDGDGTQIEPLGKYYALKLLSTTIPPGSSVLPLRLSGGARPWTYGRKGRLQVAAVRQPQGDVAYVATNYSSPTFTEHAGDDFASQNAGLPARSILLRVTAPPWVGPDSQATILRPETEGIPPAMLPVVDGTVSVELAPLDLVAIRFSRPVPDREP